MRLKKYKLMITIAQSAEEFNGKENTFASIKQTESGKSLENEA